MPTTYGTYSTYATGPPEPLTLDTVIKLRELMEDIIIFGEGVVCGSLAYPL